MIIFIVCTIPYIMFIVYFLIMVFFIIFTVEGAVQWLLLGLLTFLDPPRPDSKKTLEEAEKRFGVQVMTTTTTLRNLRL